MHPNHTHEVHIRDTYYAVSTVCKKTPLYTGDPVILFLLKQKCIISVIRKHFRLVTPFSNWMFFGKSRRRHGLQNVNSVGVKGGKTIFFGDAHLGNRRITRPTLNGTYNCKYFYAQESCHEYVRTPIEVYTTGYHARYVKTCGRVCPGIDAPPGDTYREIDYYDSNPIGVTHGLGKFSFAFDKAAHLRVHGSVTIASRAPRSVQPTICARVRRCKTLFD